jgi:TatD DNase family protein
MLIDMHSHSLFNQNSNHLVLSDGIHFLGIHPWFIDLDKLEKQKKIIEELIKSKKLLMLGETGLDRLKSSVPIEIQIEVFLWHLEKAYEHNLPIVIHCLKAHSDLLGVLKKDQRTFRLLIHDYSGGEKELKDYLKYDVYFSFGRSLFRENSKAQMVFKKVPLNRIFLETDDSKDLSIDEIYLKAQSIRVDDLIERQIFENFLRFFNYSNDISPSDLIANFTKIYGTDKLANL